MNVSNKIMLTLFACCALAGSMSAAGQDPNKQLCKAISSCNKEGMGVAFKNGAIADGGLYGMAVATGDPRIVRTLIELDKVERPAEFYGPLMFVAYINAKPTPSDWNTRLTGKSKEILKLLAVDKAKSILKRNLKSANNTVAILATAKN